MSLSWKICWNKQKNIFIKEQLRIREQLKGLQSALHLHSAYSFSWSESWLLVKHWKT